MADKVLPFAIDCPSCLPVGVPDPGVNCDGIIGAFSPSL